MFSLALLSYHACSDEEKLFYNSLNSVPINIGLCCKNIIEYIKIKKKNYTKTIDVCEDAAYYGHLKCLKFAHQNGGELNRSTLINAAISGDLDCMKYALENGCPWKSNYAEELEDYICGVSSEGEEVCAASAGNGHLECLKYLHENGCPWDETTTLDAASYGHMECLRYAIHNGCPYRYGKGALLKICGENIKSRSKSIKKLMQ